MARIKIKIPVPSQFETYLTVRVTDLNYGGHLGNDAVLGLCHEARVHFLEACELRELDNGNRIGLIMADAGIEYKLQTHLGTQLRVAISIDNIRPVGFDVYYEITTLQGKLVARVKTGHVGFDYEARKLTYLPDTVHEKIRSFIHREPVVAHVNGVDNRHV
jgi:acyl-CoA thioesterase FadM